MYCKEKKIYMKEDIAKISYANSGSFKVVFYTEHSTFILIDYLNLAKYALVV